MKIRLRVIHYTAPMGLKTTYAVMIDNVPCGEYETHEELVFCLEGHGYRANRDVVEVVY